MMTSQVDIAIVGGGLMGATLALLLGRSLPQCSIGLFDKNALEVSSAEQLFQPSFDDRCTALSPTSVNVFRRLQLWQGMSGSSTPIQKIHVSDKDRSGWVQIDSADNHGEPLGFVVENRVLGWVLSRALAEQNNINLFAPALVKSIQMGLGGAQLRSESGENFCRARLVIVADGADSPLRDQLGIDFEQKDYSQSAIVANIATQSAHRSVAYERFTDSGPLALLPRQGGGGNRMALVWSVPKQHVDEVMALSDELFLARLQKVFGYRLGSFLRVGARTAYPLRLVVAKEQVRSHLLLMGNAAHFLHPVAGQGFNLALRDGLRLVDVLQQIQPAEYGRLEVLQSYERLQRLDQRRTILLSDGFNQLFSSRQFSRRALRTLGMFAVQHTAWLRSLFIEQMSGRASPMSKWVQ